MSKPSLYVVMTAIVGILGLFSAGAAHATEAAAAPLVATCSSAIELSMAATEGEDPGLGIDAKLNCVAQCVRIWRICIQSGDDRETCNAEREACKEDCYRDLCEPGRPGCCGGIGDPPCY